MQTILHASIIILTPKFENTVYYHFVHIELYFLFINLFALFLDSGLCSFVMNVIVVSA
jgi:hypothetical protein